MAGERSSKACTSVQTLIAGDVILIQESVPALDLLVFVLQAFVPVFQTLAFGGDTQLTST